VNRFKQWAFFQIMAWCSLFRPKIGQEMIDCAQEGKDKRDVEQRMNAIFGNAQRSVRSGRRYHQTEWK